MRQTAETILAAMPTAAAELHREITKLRGWTLAEVPADELGRELIVTPFAGAYGPAGAVVALNGSPPRFLAIVLDEVVYVLAPPYPRMRPLTEGCPANRRKLRRAVLAYVRWVQETTPGLLLLEAQVIVRKAWESKK